MAINLTYDPSNDPETMEAEDQRDAEALEVGERLAEEQDELLAGKYKDAEELEQAYIELQKKLGVNDNDSQEKEESVDEVEEETEDFEETEVSRAIEQASDEWEESGEISPETIETLSQMDSRELVETYQRLQNMYDAEESSVESTPLSDSDIDEIQNAVGGQQAYKNMTSWAQDNFSAEEIKAYDQALETGNMDSINFALQALYYRYTDAVGSDGEMIQGKPSTAVDGFRSQQEVVRAMSDPRYEDDPAYRQDVYDKLERSQIKF